MLTASGSVLYINHKDGYVPEQFVIKDTNLRNIVQLESSLGHFLALKKKIRKSILDWDSKML